MKIFFNHKGKEYPADTVTAVVPKSETSVEVRFATRSPVILNDTSVEEVLTKIKLAKFPNG